MFMVVPMLAAIIAHGLSHAENNSYVRRNIADSRTAGFRNSYGHRNPRSATAQAYSCDAVAAAPDKILVNAQKYPMASRRGNSHKYMVS
jgi:hypothetical protein